MCRNNPWGEIKCGREACISCPESKEGGGGKCKQEGVVYTITCKKCKEGGILAEYWGETARTAFERGEEHLGDWREEMRKIVYGNIVVFTTRES